MPAPDFTFITTGSTSPYPSFVVPIPTDEEDDESLPTPRPVSSTPSASLAEEKPKKTSPATIPNPNNPLSASNFKTLRYLRRQGFRGFRSGLSESLFEDGFVWRTVTRGELLESDDDAPKWLFIVKRPKKESFRAIWLHLFENPRDYIDPDQIKSVLAHAKLTLPRWLLQSTPRQYRDIIKAIPDLSPGHCFTELVIIK